MKLSEETKEKIQQEYDEWKDSQYSGKDKKERQAKGQFFTPPVLTIRMLEKFDSIEDKDILDPTAGAGGLLAAAIIAGANPRRCYGIELDPAIAEICKKRLAKLGVPSRNIRVGNALESSSYEFEEEPKSYVEIKTIDKMHISFIMVSNCRETKRIDCVLPRDKAKVTSIVSKIKERKVKTYRV